MARDKFAQLLQLRILTQQKELLHLMGAEQELNTLIDFLLAKPCWQKHWR